MASSASGGKRRGRRIEGDVEAQDIDVSEAVEVKASFDRMGLKEDLLRGIYAYGFEKPSAIQQRAIVPIVSGRDLIAQSQSGTVSAIDALAQ